MTINLRQIVTQMHKSNYYETSALLIKMGKELKKISRSQETLNSAGLMINRVTFETSLMPTGSMRGVKFASNNDLFLSGRHKPSYLKMKIKIDTIAKS